VKITLTNRQRRVPLQLPWLRQCADAALLAVENTEPGTGLSSWQSLSTIEVAIISDKVITRVHEDFLNDPTPTDVITFQHGELLISADTAAHQARARNLPPEAEVLLYLVHGLLHLRGYDDHTDTDRQAMHATQDALFETILAQSPFPTTA